VQLFEDRDNPISNVFIEVLEGVVDAIFTKTAELVHFKLWLMTELIASPTNSASICDRQGRRSVFATGGVSMAVTGMPSFRASFAEAAYNRDLLHRPAFWSDARSRAILRSQAALDAPSHNAGDRLRRSIFTRINLSKRC
jgi:hypothetical protein